MAEPVDRMRTLAVRLSAVRWHAPGVLAFEFVPTGSQPLPGFEAGAHVDLHLPNGLVRSYSLLGDGSDAATGYRIAVALDSASRGGSRYLHESLRPGTELQISAPRNLFPFDESAPRVVLVAGGIGITPLLGMAQRCAAQGIPWALHYSVALGPAPFLQDLRALAGGTVHCHYTREAGGRRMDLGAVVAQSPAGSHFYACGPAAMLDSFVAATAALPAAQVHLERFQPIAPDAEGEAEALVVELAASQREIAVPANQSILQALVQNGVDVAYACEQGYCGMCEVRVKAGAVVHKDLFKTPEEHSSEGTMMICCSRACGRLVLDL